MFRKIADNLSAVLSALCEIVVGILLLVDPVRFTSGIIVALGVILIFSGTYAAAAYFLSEPVAAAKDHKLARGLLMLLAGLFCVLRSGWFISTFPALTMVYGVMLLLVGLFKVQRAVDMFRLKKPLWSVAGIGAAVSLVSAAFILVNPFESALVLWILIGISLIAQAVTDILGIALQFKPETPPSL